MESIDNDAVAPVLSNGELLVPTKHLAVPTNDLAIQTLKNKYRTQKSDQSDVYGVHMVEKLTPMQQIGAKLLDKGVSILPVAPGEKYPARYDGTGWHAMGGWDQYGERLAVDAEIDAWETWPQCGVGVVLGPLSGLVVLDVDTDDPQIIAAIEAVTPPSWCRKRGSKGYAAFYQYNGETNGRFNAEVDGQTSRVVDLLSAGTQTVIPPSIHPNGDLYDWLTPFQLQEIQLDELPKLPPGYHDTLTAALKPWRGTARQSTHTGPLEIIEETELGQFDHEEIWKALDLIPYTDDDQFIRLGMALRQYGSNKLEQLEFKLEKKYWDLETDVEKI